MLCLVRYLFVISTSVVDCLGRFVPEMTYYVSSGTLNLAQLNSGYGCVCVCVCDVYFRMSLVVSPLQSVARKVERRVSKMTVIC